MPAGFLSTKTALLVLKKKLESLTLGNDKAFESVEMFDMSNLLAALQELFKFGDRICLIVHDQEQFTNARAGRELRCRQSRDVVLMIGDRHIANRQKALFGDETTPGAFSLKDTVLNSVVGLLEAGIYCEPLRGEQMVLEKKVREELQGRVVFSLTLRLHGGNVIVDLGQAPIP